MSSFQIQVICRALVEREDQSRAIRVDLSDNGAGSDLIANDGIYSRYFTRFVFPSFPAFLPFPLPHFGAFKKLREPNLLNSNSRREG